jgi:hypothetical protein
VFELPSDYSKRVEREIDNPMGKKLKPESLVQVYMYLKNDVVVACTLRCSTKETINVSQHAPGGLIETPNLLLSSTASILFVCSVFVRIKSTFCVFLISPVRLGLSLALS